jgi:hypothetical protein
MEPTVQTDRTIPSTKLIILHKNKNKEINIPCTFRKQKYYEREADKISPAPSQKRDLKIEASDMRNVKTEVIPKQQWQLEPYKNHSGIT